MENNATGDVVEKMQQGFGDDVVETGSHDTFALIPCQSWK